MEMENQIVLNASLLFETTSNRNKIKRYGFGSDFDKG